MQIKYLLIIVCWLVYTPLSTLFAQPDNSSTNMTKYTPDFKFKDGLYLNFEQVRLNKPIARSRILTSVDYKSKTFYDEITEGKTIAYFDDLGNSQEVNVNQIWGYGKNGVLYIGIGGAFNRITVVGSICHFVASITTYSDRYNYGPYGYGGYYPYGYSPYGYSPYGYSSPSYRTTEMRQFLLDFNTGKVLDYDTKSVGILLMSDPELHDEYSGLRSKKQDQLKFMYIRKYNEKHPLYIPK